MILVLKVLWKMLSLRERLRFASLIVLMIVSGIFEMGGMLALFGFLRGLSVHQTTGLRSGPIAKLLSLVLSPPLSDAHYALWGGLLLFTIMVSKNIQGALSRFYVSQFFSRKAHRISAAIYTHYVKGRYEAILRSRNKSPSDLVENTYKLFSKCFSATAQVLSDGAVLLMIVGFLLFNNITLTVIIILVFAVFGISLHRGLSKTLKRMGEQSSEAQSRSIRSLREGIRCLIPLRLRGASSRYVQEYSQQLRERSKLERRTQALKRLPRTSNELLLTTGIVATVLYIVYSGQQLADSLPTLALFGFSVMRANGAQTRISTSFQYLRMVQYQFERRYRLLKTIIPEVLNSAPVNTDTEQPEPEQSAPFEEKSKKIRHALKIEGASFRYPHNKKDTLKSLTFSIQKGEFIGICGASGGGKSTLLLLLMGILSPTKGTIKCDDWEIKNQIRAWQRLIGYVSQDLLITSGTIEHNVTLGTAPSDISTAKVTAALKKAQAFEFVNKLVDKTNTKIVDDASNLSGGQRQRLSIARALYHEPEVLIFDEATSALDNIMEREVTNAIEAVRGDTTVIMVAHRLSTLRKCDRIFVIDQGKVVAEGSYPHLEEESSHFQALLSAAHELPEA